MAGNKNSGKRKGAVAVRSKVVAEKLHRDGKIMPLEVMIDNMRAAYDLAILTRLEVPDGLLNLDDPRLALHMQYRNIAQGYAKEAAQYLHAKLSNIELSSKDDAPIRHIVKFENVGEAAAAYARAIKGC